MTQVEQVTGVDRNFSLPSWASNSSNQKTIHREQYIKPMLRHKL